VCLDLFNALLKDLTHGDSGRQVVALGSGLDAHVEVRLQLKHDGLEAGGFGGQLDGHDKWREYLGTIPQFTELGCVSNELVEMFDWILAVTPDDLYHRLALSNLMEPEVTSSNDASMVVKLTLDAFTAEKLLVKKPRSLPTATFCALLIEQALDMPCTLAERAAASVASTSTSSSLIKEDFSLKQESKAVSAKKKRVRPDYNEGFTAFWNEYQRAPIKANAQSKNKAFEQWKEALKLETSERLLEAARRAVEQVKQAKLQDEWCAPLPDAFRWLRDERFTVYLEDHVPAGPRVINGYTVYE
jgi:hypothetical protein